MANIVAICSGCQARYQVASTNAGKKFRCQKCQTIVTVPELSHSEEDIDDFLSDIIDSSAAQTSSSSGIRRAPSAAARGRSGKPAAAPRQQRTPSAPAAPARGRQAPPQKQAPAPRGRQAQPPRGRQAPPPKSAPPARGPAGRGGRGAPPPAPDARGPGRGRQPAPQKNNTPVIIGVAAGALLLLVVLGFVVMGGDSSGGGSTDVVGGDGGGGGNSPGTTVDPGPTPEEIEAQKQADYDNLYNMGNTAAQVSGKVSSFQRAAEFAEQTWGEEDERAVRAWRAIITVDPDNSEARRKLGYRKYRYPEDAIEDDPYLALADIKTDLLEDLYEMANEGRWLSPEEYENVLNRQKELFDTVREEMRRREEDPSYAMVRQVEGNIELHPYWKTVDMEARFYHDELPCYIFFIEKGGNRSVDELGLEKKRIGITLFDFFKENWADPAQVDKVDDQPMVCFVLSSRQSYEAYCAYQGTRLPPGARAHFAPFDRPLRPVMFYEGPISAAEMQNNPEGAIADNVRVFCHECTHQLHNRYTHSDNENFHCMLHLFLEGLAEFHGGVEIHDGGQRFEMPGNYDSRLEEFYEAWMAKEEWPSKYGIPANRIAVAQPIMPLQLILAIRHSGELQRLGQQLSQQVLGTPNGMTIFGSLFYAQAWSFFKFLWSYRNGYYRDELQEYASREFHGETGIQIFREIFDLDTNEDIWEMEDQWIEWVMDLMDEVLGKRPDPFNTSYREQGNNDKYMAPPEGFEPRMLAPENVGSRQESLSDPFGLFQR